MRCSSHAQLSVRALLVCICVEKVVSLSPFPLGWATTRLSKHGAIENIRLCQQILLAIQPKSRALLIAIEEVDRVVSTSDWDLILSLRTESKTAFVSTAAFALWWKQCQERIIWKHGSQVDSCWLAGQSRNLLPCSKVRLENSNDTLTKIRHEYECFPVWWPSRCHQWWAQQIDFTENPGPLS